ncbi:ATS1 [Candida pseudojiufengensis]|uniref:ATS1 n=1 Tax=Candida pseudojiufengensis TaxID=497109 RepID=UPI002224F18D|nr:ATS1 [Candida pseudojiufengensis]KAI5962670.1 ATS1 [Candida pseudojiufengensis]
MYQVLSCGSNGDYQLGQGNDEDQSILKPSIFRTIENGNDHYSTTINSKPVEIACGGNHTIIRMFEGTIYSAGSNTFGQIGKPISIKNDQTFSQVKFEKKIKKIACCWESSFIITEDDEIYSIGKGLKGELGLGKDVTETSEFKLIKKFDIPILDIQAAMNHVVVRLADGSLSGWGNCRKGQLGEIINPSLIKQGAIWEPWFLQMGTLKGNDHFGVGREFTIITVNGKPHLYGKLNNSNIEDIQSLQKIRNVKTMWSSIHFQTDDSFISFGINSHGQLFDYKPKKQFNAAHVDFETGSEHGLLLLDSEVYAWGWGEHGNCGISKTNDTNTFNYLNPIFTNDDSEASNIIYFKAGCATSWVVIEIKKK